MEDRAIKVASPGNMKLELKVVPGHFATNHSHISHYIDMTTIKCRQSVAYEAAKEIVKEYRSTTPVDTIVCMDGCEAIGALLAEQLSDAGFMSMNQHQSIYVITPEFNSNGQMIFRDNLQPMVRNKHILLLLASATTGQTISRSLECIEYYGGIVEGISAIFSAIDTVDAHEVHSIFHVDDLPEYHTYKHNDCPYCKAGKPIEAIVNSYGYSRL